MGTFVAARRSRVAGKTGPSIGRRRADTVAAMFSALLVVVLAAPDLGLTVWRFPNPESEALRAAVVEARGDDPTHRVTDAEIEALVAGPVTLGGCLVDARPCQDVGLDVLGLYGVQSRVDATSRTEAGQFVVELVVAPTAGGARNTVTARGETLVAAAAAALATVRGQSMIQVSVKPPDATVSIDGLAVGQGDGAYAASPGAHVVRVEAAGFTPLEQTTQVAVGATAVLSFELGVADGELMVVVDPPTATVKIAGAVVADLSKPVVLAPGTYPVEITAPDHVPYQQEITVKLATRHDLKVTLPARAPSWQEALQSPHPDTLARSGYLRADLRFASIFDGPVDVASGRDAERLHLESQDDSVGLLGLDLGVGWRHRYWFIEALGLSFDGGGSTRSVTMEAGEGAIESLTRIGLRPGWVGLRYPAWRLDPYVAAGVVVVFESFDLVVGDDTRAIDNRLFEVGVEFGLRYAIDADWFASVAGRFDFWFDERTSGAVLLGAGWALDLPEWL